MISPELCELLTFNMFLSCQESFYSFHLNSVIPTIDGAKHFIHTRTCLYIGIFYKVFKRWLIFVIHSTTLSTTNVNYILNKQTNKTEEKITASDLSFYFSQI